MDQKSYYAIAECRDLIRHSEEAIKEAEEVRLEAMRTVVSLIWHEDLPKKEIASILGINMQQLGSMISRVNNHDK